MALPFNPSEHFIQLKGKDYLMVQWRLVWFREDHPDWSIVTEPVINTPESAVFNCRIINPEGKVLAMAHGSCSPKKFSEYIEKAETKAVGRALAYLGYGTQFAPELEDDEDPTVVGGIADTPVPSKKKPAPPSKAKPKAPPVEDPEDDILEELDIIEELKDALFDNGVDTKELADLVLSSLGLPPVDELGADDEDLIRAVVDNPKTIADTLKGIKKKR